MGRPWRGGLGVEALGASARPPKAPPRNSKESPGPPEDGPQGIPKAFLKVSTEYLEI